MIRLLLSTVLILSTACSSLQPIAQTESFPAAGVFVRHVRLRVAPAQTKDFEALMERCVAAAQAAELGAEWEWLCYRESPGRYWLITFSGTADGFMVPASTQPLSAHARTVADQASPAARVEIDRLLAALEYEIEWTIVSRQKAAWSTVGSMTTSENPKARLMLRTVRPGQEAAFERALAKRVEFLIEHDYPLPVEGFVVLSGAPGTAMQVVFPTDWMLNSSCSGRIPSSP